MIALPVIFIVWFIVTVFFYCQHYRVEKVYSVNEEVVFDNFIVQIKDLTIVNYMPIKERVTEYSERRWYLKFARKLPSSFQIPFVNICYFYSRPYEFNNQFGNIRAEGLILDKTIFLGNDLSNIWDAVDIDIYDENERYYGRGRHLRHHDQSNYYLFGVKGENASLKSNSFNLLIRDKSGKQVRTYAVRPEWTLKTYTYFNKRTENYPFDPLYIIHSFLSPMRQGKKEVALKYLHPGEKNALWAVLDHGYWEMGGNDYVVYEGKKDSFERVYSSNITFGRYESGFTPEDLIPVASQKIYFVIRDGSPLVIDADPLTVPPRQN